MHLLSCFPGWTWEYIDDFMTIPRLIAITKYHKQFPSLHVMVAAYLGAGEKPSVDGAFTNTGMDEKGQSLFDLFPQSGMG